MPGILGITSTLYIVKLMIRLYESSMRSMIMRKRQFYVLSLQFGQKYAALFFEHDELCSQI